MKLHMATWNKNGDHPDDYAEDTQGLENGELRTFTGAERKEKGWEGSVVRYFRHPNIEGSTKCLHCGHIAHDHGWIDSGGKGITVCPGDVVITTKSKPYWNSPHLPLGTRFVCKPFLANNLLLAIKSDAKLTQ